MSAPHDSDAPKDYEFVVTDYLQRLETWAVEASHRHSDIRAVLATSERYQAAVLVPICGKAFQKHGTIGIWPDGFSMQRARFRFEARSDIHRVSVAGWMPEQHPNDVEITIACGERSAVGTCAPGSAFAVELDLDIPAGREAELAFELSSSFQPASPGEGGDSRHLGWILQWVEFS